MLRALRLVTHKGKEEKSRSVLREVFAEWRLSALLSKESRAVDEVIREEESVRAGDLLMEGGEVEKTIQERKRNERFLMLLNVGGFAAGQNRGPTGGWELRGRRDHHAERAEGTVWTSEGGTEDGEEMAIKSAF